MAKLWKISKFVRIYLGFKPDGYSRIGECKRCGKCCAIGIRCPFLFYKGDLAFCWIYDTRPKSCREFPYEPQDIVIGCGYSFYKKRK